MDAKKTARIFKALSNQNRLELFLQILRKREDSFKTCGECFIIDIIGSFSIGAPTISHHLKELANAELITTERRGKHLVCKVNEHIINHVKDILDLDQTDS